MKILTDLSGEALNVNIQGEMDLYTSPELKEVIKELITEKKGIIIDLQEVTYLDSSGIGVMLFCFTFCRKNSIPIVFSSLRASVKEVLILSQLHKFLPLSDTLSQAEDFIKERVRA